MLIVIQEKKSRIFSIIGNMLFQPAISIVGKQNKQIFNGFNRLQIPVQGDKTVKTVQFFFFFANPAIKIAG